MRDCYGREKCECGKCFDSITNIGYFFNDIGIAGCSFVIFNLLWFFWKYNIVVVGDIFWYWIIAEYGCESFNVFVAVGRFLVPILKYMLDKGKKILLVDQKS